MGLIRLSNGLLVDIVSMLFNIKVFMMMISVSVFLIILIVLCWSVKVIKGKLK